MIKCSFCGNEFDEEEARGGCQGCPLNRSCKKVKCPECGFEMPGESGLIRLIKKWRSKSA